VPFIFISTKWRNKIVFAASPMAMHSGGAHALIAVVAVDPGRPQSAVCLRFPMWLATRVGKKQHTIWFIFIIDLLS
jgi:hypothetical protein